MTELRLNCGREGVREGAGCRERMAAAIRPRAHALGIVGVGLLDEQSLFLSLRLLVQALCRAQLFVRLAHGMPRLREGDLACTERDLFLAERVLAILEERIPVAKLAGEVPQLGLGLLQLLLPLRQRTPRLAFRGAPRGLCLREQHLALSKLGLELVDRGSGRRRARLLELSVLFELGHAQLRRVYLLARGAMEPTRLARLVRGLVRG